VYGTGGGLVCGCPDRRKNGSDCRHIKVVPELIKRNAFGRDGFRIIERSGPKLCEFCDSRNVVKRGLRRNKTSTMQVSGCRDCKRRFAANFGLERKQHGDRTITGALQMCYAGMSVRDIADCYEMMGAGVSKTVYNWIDECSRLAAVYPGGTRAGIHACAGGAYGDALPAHLGFEGDLADSSGRGNGGTARGDVRYTYRDVGHVRTKPVAAA